MTATSARADVVGSLLRPPELLAAAKDFYASEHRAVLESERSQDRRELTEIEDRAIAAVVGKQIDIGLDTVTDGELRRYMFQNSFWDALAGFTTDRNPVEFRADDGSTVTWHVHRIEERLSRTGANPAALEADHLAKLTDHNFKITFPAASLLALPFTYKPGVNDHAYSDLDDLVNHCVDLESALVAEAVAAGAREIQFDFPAYPYLVDPTWQQALAEIGWSVDAALEVAVAADTAVRRAVPEGVTASMHVCRGNNQSRYLCEGPLDAVAEAMFGLPYDRFLVEWEDRERMGGFGALAAVPRPGPTIVLGLISSKRPEPEAAEEVCELIDEAADLLPLDQLAVSTQCGFASTLPGNSLTEADQWRKLELVVEVAGRVWG